MAAQIRRTGSSGAILLGYDDLRGSGGGGDQDWIAGYAWIHLAAENRLDDALELRDRLREQLEPSQIWAAERHSESLLQAGAVRPPATGPEEAGLETR